MTRVFMKKGWGVTDEQYLLGAFAKDLAVKATMIYSLKKQGNEMIKQFVNASKNLSTDFDVIPPSASIKSIKSYIV